MCVLGLCFFCFKALPSFLHVKGDAADIQDLHGVIEQYGPFDACVHTIGLLLDNESGLSQYNQLVSGSGSVPGSDSSYDRITRQTAENAIDCFKEQNRETERFPFVFISAAEVLLTFTSLFVVSLISFLSSIIRLDGLSQLLSPSLKDTW